MIFKMYRLQNSRRDKRDDENQNITEQEEKKKKARELEYTILTLEIEVFP